LAVASFITGRILSTASRNSDKASFLANMVGFENGSCSDQKVW